MIELGVIRLKTSSDMSSDLPRETGHCKVVVASCEKAAMN